MSYNDFLIVQANGNQASSLTGSSVANTDFPSSAQCRVYNYDLQSNNMTSAFYTVNSSVSGGLCVNIPQTKSISLRCWVFPDTFNYYNANRFGLIAKHNGKNSNQYMNGNIDSSYPNSGYEFIYDALTYSQNTGYFRFSRGGYTNPTQVKIDGVFGTRYDINKWYGMRMDIIPVKVNRLINGIQQETHYKDVIKLYLAESSSPNTWNLFYTEEILTTDPTYVPWGSYIIPSNGSAQAYNESLQNRTISESKNGFALQCGSNSNRMYIDEFKMYVKDAF